MSTHLTCDGVARRDFLRVGALAGVAAVLLTASLSSAAPNMAGDFLLTAIAAVLLGYGLGFALLVPFGGLHLGQPKHPFVRCDVMGCKVVPAAKPGT